MKRVLIIGNRIPLPARDGGALAILQILKLYVKAGFEVDFVTLNTSKHFVTEDIIHSELDFLNSIEKVNIDTQLKLGALLKNLLLSAKSYNLSRFYSKELEDLILRKIQENEYDCIHIESLFAATVLPVLKQNFQRPIYIRVHNIEHQIWQRMAENEQNIFKRKYLKIMAQRLQKEELLLLSLANGLLHISNSDLAFFESQLPAVKHIYLPFVVEENTQIEYPDATPASVGFIGSLEWLPNQHGLDWFLDKVWANVRVAIPDAVLRIAGKNIPDKYRSDEHCGIEVMGEVQYANNFMHQQQVLIVPLFSGSGIRIKTIEAMANGIAVVSTTIGAQGLGVVPGEDILIADTAKDFSKALILLLTNEMLRLKLEKNGESFVQHNHNESKAISVLKSLC